MQEAISSAAIEAEEPINNSGVSAANTNTKRKRGSTTTKKPPAKRSNLQPTAPLPHADTAAHLHEVENAPGVDSLSSSRRLHETRTTNNPHPAKSVGLEKRRQTDIAEAAAIKKADKQAKIDAKEHDRREKTIREHQGVVAVAALLDKHRRGQASNESTYGPEQDHNGDVSDELPHQISQVALHSEDDDLLRGEHWTGVDSSSDEEEEIGQDVRLGETDREKQTQKPKVSNSFPRYSHRFIPPTSFSSRRSARERSASNVLVRFGPTSTMHALPRETKGFVLRVHRQGPRLPACT